MNFILIIDKIMMKIARRYREAVFNKKIGCTHNTVEIVGKITLINTNVTIGQNVVIYPDVMFFGDGLIRIGDNVAIGNGTIIYSSKEGGGVYIGSNSMIAAQCYIIDTDHGFKAGEMIINQKNISSPISVGEDVWIAANCTILKGSRIGDGAVIGAKSLVKGDISANSICVGIPAREIRKRR